MRRLLPLVVVLAFACRMWGIGFGLPYAGTRPDETDVAGIAVNMLSGGLAPPHFLYPSLFYYVVAFLYMTWYDLGRLAGSYSTLAAFADSRHQSIAPFLYLTRTLSATMGTLTVWWVYRICRRLFDETTAIVAALFLALAYLHVRDSHFGVTDVTMTALIVLAVDLILRWDATGDPGAAAVAGLVGGLAASIKYNGLGVVVPFLVAAVQRLARRDGRPAEPRRVAGSIAAFAATFAGAFFAGSPYILVRWHQFVSDVSAQQASLAYGRGMGLRGWWHHALITLPAAVGWPICLAAVAGAALMLVDSRPRAVREASVLLAFPLAYYLVSGSGYTTFARYMVPIVPFLCIAAARPTARLAAMWGQERRVAASAAVAVGALALVAVPARNVLLVDRLFTRDDSRVVAARMLAELVPRGSLVYHSGSAFGHVPFKLPGYELDAMECEYDEPSGQFRNCPRLPGWMVIQRSPLMRYSDVPAGVEQLVHDRYELARTILAQPEGSRAVYDQQDAFFLPLDGLGRTIRPGPNFEIYRLRTDTVPRAR